MVSHGRRIVADRCRIAASRGQHERWIGTREAVDVEFAASGPRRATEKMLTFLAIPVIPLPPLDLNGAVRAGFELPFVIV